MGYEGEDDGDDRHGPTAVPMFEWCRLVLKARLPERLTPLAASHGLRPHYGDIHNHCALSYGHGSLEGALERAKRQLDFVSVTGHAHWPDMPADDPLVAHIVNFHAKGFAKLAALWPGHFASLAKAAAPGSFTVFPGYEIHSSRHGDYTILYRDLDPEPFIKADSPAQLLAHFKAQHPGRALAFPHHIGYRQGARGINWNTFLEALSPMVEIVSMHGCSEASIMDRPFLHSMGPSNGNSTARAGLAGGHVFGFLGNTDHHSGYPGSYGHGRSCLYAPHNSAAALWDAMWARNGTALTGDCIHLFTAMDGHPLGSIVPPGGTMLDVEAVGGGEIDYIDVIRNSRLAARISPALTPSPIEASGPSFETILVLELGWGERGRHHDWTGSIEVVDGALLAVEPRLRGPEVVSPLEGEEEDTDRNRVTAEDERIDFFIRTHANPNNATPATQAIAALVRLGETSRVRLVLDGQRLELSIDRLLQGSVSGNLGAIDSPAYRVHPVPRPQEWQWRGRIPLDPLRDGESLYVRLRQTSGQWAWASPIFCRAP